MVHQVKEVFYNHLLRMDDETVCHTVYCNVFRNLYISVFMASSSVATGLRPRVRLPKAKPNIMGGARRSAGITSSTVVTTPKPAAAAAAAATNEPQKEIKSPPPVRRVTQLEIPKPDQLLNEVLKISQPSTLVNSNNELECAENSDLLPTSFDPEDACSKEVSPKKSPQTLEKLFHQTTTISSNNIKKVRKTSARVGNENKEKDEIIKVRHKKGQVPPDRAKMTMFDLIYWNPETNPMTYEDDEHRPPLASKEINTVVLSSENAERLAEEAVDDPEFVGESEEGATKENEAEKIEESMPVPQVKIGPDGNIILDEQSLVIETTASKIDISSSPVVYGRQNNTTYASFRNKKQTKTWSDKETAKFYVALSSVGTDFSMMANLFPKRERKELKLKFKREEKFNRELVDKAIRDRQQYDLSIFDESDDELENEGEKSVENITKGHRKQGSGQGRKKKPESTGQNGCNKEKGKRKKPNGKKRIMQEDDDSDYDEVDVAYGQELEPTDDLAKQPDTNQSNSCDKEAVGSVIESPINTEENFIEKENSDDVELLEGVLKQTRSGRQPKKRALFTILDKEPKKRAKKPKFDDNISVSTPMESVNTCTTTVIASKDVSGDEITSINTCSDFPHPFSAQKTCQEKFPIDICTIMQPETPPCADFHHNISKGESREIDLVETICNNYPIADSTAKYDEEDEQDEENQQEYRILEGVLKKTRAGRQPKMKSVFTIDNSKHKKEIKERGVTNQTISPAKVTQPFSQLTNPLPSILATSPSELYLLAEKPSEDGSQVVHLYMMSPPVQASPVSVVESPTNSDHDYVLQNLVNIPVDIRETTAELDPSISLDI